MNSIDPQTPAQQAHDRATKLARIAYASMAAGLLLYIVAICIQVVIDIRKMQAVSIDRFTEFHRHWRLRSSLMFLIWSAFAFLTFPVGLGWVILIPAWLWYCYRILRGFLRFRADRLPPGMEKAASQQGPAPAIAKASANS